MKEAKLENHWNNASEYKNYSKLVKNNPDFTIFYDGSKKFVDDKQLLKLNIMKTSEEFDLFY